jgi:DNA excision repair protein ERCC-2
LLGQFPGSQPGIYAYKARCKEYEDWLERRLADIVAREKQFESARKRRKKNGKLTFPFEVQRQGQKELLDTIGKHLQKGGRMLLQAPTGLGKTMGVTLPTLEDSLARGQKMIYLTAKNSQHSVAEDAVERLQNTGASIRSLSLLSKRKMCFKEEVMCDPSYCEYAKDHYTKFAQHNLSEQLLKKKNLNEKSIKQLAEKYEVCPFELQMEGAAFADVVIGDYNYIFSPHNVRERLSKNSLGKSTSLPNLVIDEAHNLPARAADYFSAELALPMFQDLLMAKNDYPYAIQGMIEALYEAAEEFFEEIREEEPESRRPRVIQLSLEDLDSLREGSQRLLSSYLESDEPLRREDPILNIYNRVIHVADILENYREEFVLIYEGPSRFAQSLKIVCVDAAWWLKQAYEDFANVIAFSATLKPFEYYRELLGLSDATVCSEFESPFPRENRKVLIVPQVSTKLKDRAANISKIRTGIEKIVSVRPGNYFVFFPSFDFLEKTAIGFEIPGFEVIHQKRKMDKSEIEGILERLKEKDKPVVIFAVQGGVFSEGVDYPGKSLIGAIIIGPALPAFNFEREQMREFYEKKFGHGFNYAYIFPAMARTIQSAGRVIRSATDRGLIVLMDRRFLEENYRASMPSDWAGDDPQSLSSNSILSDLQTFWQGDENGDENLEL